ncbi:Uncharacterised protein [Yersinia frederiksenii]|nr:Uncharacterised protein [Yersinia frederiksenii]
MFIVITTKNDLSRAAVVTNDVNANITLVGVVPIKQLDGVCCG